MLAVEAPGRLHCALLNETGIYSRIDGGIGFAVRDPCWKVTLDFSPSAQNTAGKLPIELQVALNSVIDLAKSRLDIPYMGCSVEQSIPLHAGLGSKTSLLMAVGWGISAAQGLNWTAEQIAQFVGRGGTSGIGIHALSSEGLIWDIGRKYPDEKPEFKPSSSSSSRPPRKSFNFLPKGLKAIHFRFEDRGIYGEAEAELFKLNCPVPPHDTKEVLAIVAGQLIPSFIDQDLTGIQDALTRIQGLGIKKAEWSAQGPSTKRFRQYFSMRDPKIALGLSSMGPTMYCIHREPDRIKHIVDTFDIPPLHFSITDFHKAMDQVGS
jgi:beta-ribofuranosylaminobenzene 5'-phosphate synthase